MSNENFNLFSSQVAPNLLNNLLKMNQNDDVFYYPSATQSKTGTYEALIRFLYNPLDPQKTIISKTVATVKDLNGNLFYFDSALSNNNFDCLIFKLKKKLKYSSNPYENELKDNIMFKKVYAALVYIVDDKNNPELNGKIKIFKFGAKIKAKIDKAILGRGNTSNTPTVDIFNFFNGRDFNLIITLQGKYNNYEDSYFEPQPSPIVINGKEIKETPEDIALLKNFMKNAPDLEKHFAYHPLSGKELEKFNEIVHSFEKYVEGRMNKQFINQKTSLKQVDTIHPTTSAKDIPGVIKDTNTDTHQIPEYNEWDDLLNDINMTDDNVDI